MNPDTLKRAIELADGWELRDGTSFFVAPWPYCQITDTDCPQYVLDALAAQLVRQVDALDKMHVSIGSDYADVWHEDGSIEIRKIGDDRTENTITCIVESGVLE